MHNIELQKSFACVLDMLKHTEKYSAINVWMSIFTGNCKCPNCKGFWIKNLRPKLKSWRGGDLAILYQKKMGIYVFQSLFSMCFQPFSLKLCVRPYMQACHLNFSVVSCCRLWCNPGLTRNLKIFDLMVKGRVKKWLYPNFVEMGF